MWRLICVIIFELLEVADSRSYYVPSGNRWTGSLSAGRGNWNSVSWMQDDNAGKIQQDGTGVGSSHGINPDPRINEVAGYNSGQQSQVPLVPFRSNQLQNANTYTANQVVGPRSSNNQADQAERQSDDQSLGYRPDKCKKPTGQFAVPFDCTRFYNCHDNYAWIMTCPDGLAFNETIAACDYPDAVGCAVVKNIPNQSRNDNQGPNAQPAGPSSGNNQNSGRPNTGTNQGYEPSSNPSQQQNPSNQGGGNFDNQGQQTPGTSNNYDSNYGGPNRLDYGTQGQYSQQSNANWLNGPKNQRDENSGMGSNLPPRFYPNTQPSSGTEQTSWQNGQKPSLQPCVSVGGGQIDNNRINERQGATQIANRQSDAPNSSNYNAQSGYPVIESPTPGPGRDSRPHSSALNNPGASDILTIYGPNGPQTTQVIRCRPCDEQGAVGCVNYPAAKCFDDVCGNCKARFFVPRPGSSSPFAEVTSMCITSANAASVSPPADNASRIRSYR